MYRCRLTDELTDHTTDELTDHTTDELTDHLHTLGVQEPTFSESPLPLTQRYSQPPYTCFLCILRVGQGDIVISSLLVDTQLLWNMPAALRHRGKGSRQTMKYDGANDSSQQVVTSIAVASSATAHVDDAVLQTRDTDGMSSMGIDPFLHGVSHGAAPCADLMDLCDQYSLIRGMVDNVVKGMDPEESFHGDPSGCDGTMDDESDDSTLTLLLFNALIPVMSLPCSAWYDASSARVPKGWRCFC